MTPVRMSRLPDGAAPKKQRKPARTTAEKIADLERSLAKATSPLEITMKTRALAALKEQEVRETER